MKQAIAFAATLAATLCCLQCSTLTGGTGEETTNGRITGKLVAVDGLPASGTQVTLLPVLYDPIHQGAVPDTLVDTTDNQGTYSFPRIAPGYYNIQAVRKNDRTRTLIRLIKVANEPVQPPVGTMKVPGAIRVTLSPDADRAQGYLYISGTTIGSTLDANSDLVSIDSVPAGTVPALCYQEKDNPAAQRVIGHDLQVSSKSVTSLADLHMWKYSREIILNTTASGADIAGSLVDFPVLIRLNAANFNFSQAAGSGVDLRFSKSDNTTPQVFAIEYWDSSAASAALWVKVDTIHGNNTMQGIVMYWGGPANPASNAAAVFDTANGFAGVWHLTDSSLAHRIDATPDRHDGTTQAYNGDEQKQGIIGNADSLDTRDDAINAGDIPLTTAFTLSLWIKAASYVPWAHLIAKASDPVSAPPWLTWGLQLDSAPAPHISLTVTTEQGDSSIETASTLPLEEWMYVAGTFDGSRLRLYVNGNCETDAPYSGAIVENANPAYIGKLQGSPEQRFNGVIDEVRISRVARGNDWLRLCYENQRPNSAFIVFPEPAKSENGY
jgi:hypothetical protein